MTDDSHDEDRDDWIETGVTDGASYDHADMPTVAVGVVVVWSLQRAWMRSVQDWGRWLVQSGEVGGR
jgi:hypothetical protein